MEIFLCAILGLAIGSFLNVLILRIPTGENIAFPASHCTKCNKKLKLYHNIPLISWIFLGGKCAYCKEKISLQYPLIELITSFLFIISYLKTEDLQTSLIYSLLFSLLLVLSIIDLRYKAVPDIVSFPALFVALFTGNLSEAFYNALLFAGGFALLRMVISSIIKKEAMGEADIIIASIIGAVLGIKLGIGAIYISSVIALPAFLIVDKKGFELPFIPFLTIGMFVTWLLDKQILQLWDKIYG